MFSRFPMLRRVAIATSGGARTMLLQENKSLPLLSPNRGVSQRFLTTTNTKESRPPKESSVASSPGETTCRRQTSTSSEAATAAAAAGELLDASFADEKMRSHKAKMHKSGSGSMFPWRSSPELHERLVPGTPENYSKGLLLGGNLTSSNPRMDGFATACFFLRIPFWDMVLFRSATEQDLADSMAWAFGQAVQQITNGGGTNTRDNENENDGETISSPRLKDMMEERKLAKLFESASEFGRESLEVKLETKPILYSEGGIGAVDDNNGSNDNASSQTSILHNLPMGLRDGPKIVSLFVFPFLSRAHSGNPHHLSKYSKLLDAISASNDDTDEESANSSYAHSLELSRDLMEDFRQAGISENTVVCQVLVPCLETFWVKDTNTGKILQGDANEKAVLHLVRFEQTTKTHIVPNNERNTNDSMSSRFFPFRHELGEWKITDIDDLCDGNLLL